MTPAYRGSCMVIPMNIVARMSTHAEKLRLRKYPETLSRDMFDTRVVIATRNLPLPTANRGV